MSKTEYICAIAFSQALPDILAWEAKLLEFGIHREAFTICISPTGSSLIKFWEPDRIEALRLLSRLDGLTAQAA
jgi:hypothetical protein